MYFLVCTYTISKKLSEEKSVLILDFVYCVFPDCKYIIVYSQTAHTLLKLLTAVPPYCSVFLDFKVALKLVGF